MAPNKKTKDGDRQTGESDELIPENILARKIRNQFADNSHAGQNHDVDSRVGIKPKQVLEKHRISSDSGIENSHVSQTFKRQQKNCDGNNGRSQNHDQAGRVNGPDKQWQPKPCHAGSAHCVNRDDEIEAGQNR